ncbi:hypothetical protein QS468_37260 [Bacillus subtilis]|nr:transcriptional regulator [Pseudomonas sp. A29(2023)]MDL5598403.1 hypothetical protein [Bacillus subtilis]
MNEHYDWELIERLLHEAQNGANRHFAPREYAAQLAEERLASGRDPGGNLDALKMRAADYEALLLEGGYLEHRPEAEGGNGENFVLGARGVRLLEILGSSLPAHLQVHEQLTERGSAALVPEVFDTLADQAARA